MSNPAQDEFNALMASQNEKLTRHHADDASSISSTEDTASSTLASASKAHSQRSSKGKFTSSIRSSAHHDRDSSAENSDAEDAVARNASRPFYIPNKHGYDANTGPKGVIADARAFENERRMGNKLTYVRTEHMVLPKMQRLAFGAGQKKQQQAKDEIDEEEECEREDEGDDEYLRRWRERRAGELKHRKASVLGGGSVQGRRGRYGVLKAVDALGFLEAVEDGHPETVIVCFVYDDELEISQTYQAHIGTIAAKYADVRFIALHYEEAEMEHAGIPALLAYRNTEQFASLTPLKDEIPLTGNVVVNLEGALWSRGIL